MNRPRDQLLPGSTVPDDEHRRGRIRRVRDLLVDRQHAGRPPDETRRRHVERRTRRGRKPDIGERPFDSGFDFGDVEGLADVVEGAGAHGINRGLQRLERMASQ